MGILIAIVVILLIAVFILAYFNTQYDPETDEKYILKLKEMCESEGSYWSEDSEQCFYEPPGERQISPQKLCEDGGLYWDTDSGQCMNVRILPALITDTATLASKSTGEIEPRIACLIDGMSWDDMSGKCVDIPDSKTVVEPTPTTTGGRYIRIERVSNSTDTSGDGNAINLGEIAVTDANGKSLLSGATVTVGSLYSGMFSGNNLIDGVSSTFYHSVSGGSPYTNIWAQVDLGSNKPIYKIVVTNRTSCCKKRAIGLQLVVKNSNGDIVWTGPIINNDEDTYTYFPNL